MFMVTVAVAATTVFIIALLLWYYLKYKFFDTGIGMKYTGLNMFPLIGHALHGIGVKPHEYMDLALKYSIEHCGKMLAQLGYVFGVFVTEYSLTEFVLNSTTITKKAVTYKFFTRWLGTGLLTSNGEKWRKRRKMITPAFHYQILESQLVVFHNAGDILVDEISKNIDTEDTAIEVHSLISLCTLDIICEAAMGIKINAQRLKSSKYIKAVKEISQIYLDRLISPWNFYDMFYIFSSTYRRERKCVAYLHKHTYNIIRSRRNELLENTNKMQLDDFGSKKKYAFLDVLLQSTIDDKPLTDEDIREEVDTFMFEGHDTVSAAISFALFSIAKNPDIQAKLVQEQKLIFTNDRSRPATYNELANMKYLEMVIKETLRLYPSVPGFAREVSDDFEYDGVKFKKGLQIGLYIFGLHRNPDNFPEPEKFIPERFSPEKITRLKPFAYVPFSAGPRNCIGQKFAMLEMKSTISKIVRFFELQAVVPEHILQLVPETILRCANGLPVRFRYRHFHD